MARVSGQPSGTTAAEAATRTEVLSEADELLGEFTSDDSASEGIVSYAVGDQQVSMSADQAATLLAVLGVTDEASATSLVARAADGNTYITRLRDSAKKTAILAYGAAEGTKLAEQIDAMEDATTAQAALATYTAASRNKELSGPQGGKRQTTPVPIPGAISTGPQGAASTAVPSLKERIEAERLAMRENGL